MKLPRKVEAYTSTGKKAELLIQQRNRKQKKRITRTLP